MPHAFESFGYSDVASYADSSGLMNYNVALNLMEANRFIPFYEKTYKEIDMFYSENYGCCDELQNLFDRFLISKNLSSACIFDL